MRRPGSRQRRAYVLLQHGQRRLDVVNLGAVGTLAPVEGLAGPGGSYVPQFAAGLIRPMQCDQIGLGEVPQVNRRHDVTALDSRIALTSHDLRRSRPIPLGRRFLSTTAFSIRWALDPNVAVPLSRRWQRRGRSGSAPAGPARGSNHAVARWEPAGSFVAPMRKEEHSAVSQMESSFTLNRTNYPGAGAGGEPRYGTTEVP